MIVGSEKKTDFLVTCTRLYNPLCPSVGLSVCQSVTLCFFAAPAHPHATKVAVYPALLRCALSEERWENKLSVTFLSCEKKNDWSSRIFSCVIRDYTPLCCHTFLFLGFCGLWSHSSCPSDQVTSNTAPAHPYATGLAVYPALICNASEVEI